MAATFINSNLAKRILKDGLTDSSYYFTNSQFKLLSALPASVNDFGTELPQRGGYSRQNAYNLYDETKWRRDFTSTGAIILNLFSITFAPAAQASWGTIAGIQYHSTYVERGQPSENILFTSAFGYRFEHSAGQPVTINAGAIRIGFKLLQTSSQGRRL